MSIITCTQPKENNTNESWINTEEKFKIIPTDIPNTGILFINHNENNRSGHGGHVLTECKNGDNQGDFVLHSSKDGINWDDGVYLMSRQQTSGGVDCYSGNTIIGKYDTVIPDR